MPAYPVHRRGGMRRLPRRTPPAGARGTDGDRAATERAQEGRSLSVSGLVLVRQKPGSAKGVMFITLEDESDMANLIVWPSLFEKQRRIVIGAQMLACRGRVQKATGIIHVIAKHLVDHSEMLRRVGGMDQEFTVPTGRGDEAKHGGSGIDPREKPTLRKARDIYVPD